MNSLSLDPFIKAFIVGGVNSNGVQTRFTQMPHPCYKSSPDQLAFLPMYAFALCIPDEQQNDISKPLRVECHIQIWFAALSLFLFFVCTLHSQ